MYEQDREVPGWIHAFKAQRVASASFIEIGGLLISPDIRTEGKGGALVQCAVEWAEAQNLALRVRCNTQREASHQFYASIGFILIKGQNVYQHDSR